MNVISQRLNDAAFWIEKAKQEAGIITTGDSPGMAALRKTALAKLPEQPVPGTYLEAYRYTDLEKYFDTSWQYNIQPSEMPVNVESFFACEVYGLDTWLITMYNGWYTYKNAPLRILPNGTIIGSLSRAMREAPEIVDAWIGNAANLNDYFAALNAAFASDGFFIYVPDGVHLEKPIQMVNVVNHASPLFMQTRHLIIVGKGSSVKLVHCDDSHNHTAGFTNSVTEVFIGRDSQVEYYKMQNINDDSVILNKTFINQQGGSSLNTYGICLHGGLIRNEIYNQLLQPHAEANHYGLFLMDKKQQSDNIVSVMHAASDCQSNQLYKGILDDYARGVFNGHIHVKPDAQRTAAYQSNRNILLTDKAVINTKPFLEIYADDVKCSHGATVGQLDADAMFYLRARGIDSSNARLLLMYAFAADVLNHISIPTLHDRLDDLVKKRLRGELSICDQCVLHCKTPEKPIEFEIDMSKI
jgi:Fe-S cluster assembly protein SufD